MRNLPKLVPIINDNGRVGYVAESYPPLVAGDLKPAPDTAVARQEQSDADKTPPVALEQPTKNARLDAWQEYARNRPDSGLTEDEITNLGRDALVAHFTE